MSFNYNDVLNIVYRKGTVDDPYIDKSESYPIINNIIVLSEIPDRFNRVFVTGYVEVEAKNVQIPASNQFIVNYSNGVVTFNQSENGKSVATTYKGKGIIQYPAERIFAHNTDNPDIVTNLQEIIDNGNSAIEAIQQLNPIIDDAKQSTSDANTKGAYAQTEGDYAKSQGDYAKTQADATASAIANNQTATSNANAATTAANTAASSANTATASANTAASSATTQANYAKGIGDNLIWKGVYASATAYKKGNMVSYQGATYQCLNDATPVGTVPTNVTYWAKMTAFKWQGTYATTTTYSIGDFVVDSGNQETFVSIIDSNLNKALTDTTSWNKIVSVASAITSANTAASNAQAKADNTVHKGTYSSATAYVVNNIVDYNGSSYMNYVASTNIVPTDTTKWRLIGKKGDSLTWKGLYASGTAYAVNDIVSYNGSGYVCKAASTGNLPTNTTYFDLISSKGDTGNKGMSFKGAWVSTTAYVVDDAVLYDDSTYICISNTTGINPTDVTKWSLVAKRGTLSLSEITNTVTTTTETSHVVIGITGFSNQDDLLNVYVNTVHYQRGTDFTVNADGLSIDKVNGKWAIGTVIDFVVLQSVKAVPTIINSGQIADDSITNAKLGTDVKVGRIQDLTTTDKTSLVAAMNEIRTGAVYVHPTGDGYLHVPATSNTNNLKVLKAGATAGVIAWGSVDWSEIASKPSSLVIDIEDAVTKRHSKNGDNGTTDNTFGLKYSGTLADNDTAGIFVGGTVGTGHPYIRWSHLTAGNRRWEMYESYGATTPTWAELRAKKFVKSDGTEVSYSGHTHVWADLTDKPTSFTPPIASQSQLGGVKQGTYIAIDVNGVISSTYTYTHPIGDGNLHVPATGTTNGTKVLKAGATASSLSWAFVDWSEVTNRPTSYAPSPHTHTSTDLPSGTTGAVGVVQLSSATNSTSTTLAATASAVKSAYDLAALALPKTGGVMTGNVTMDVTAGANQWSKTVEMRFTGADSVVKTAYLQSDNAGNPYWSNGLGTSGKIWTLFNDGSGSLMDADFLDGLHASSFGQNYTLTTGSNLNAATASGFYRLQSGHVNAPSGVDWGQMLVVHGSSDSIWQQVTGFNNGKMYWRQGNPTDVGGTGSWTAWAELGGGGIMSPVGKERVYVGATNGGAADGTWRTIVDVSGTNGRVDYINLNFRYYQQLAYGSAVNAPTGSIRITIDGLVETFNYTGTGENYSTKSSSYTYNSLTMDNKFLHSQTYWATGSASQSGTYSDLQASAPIEFASSIKIEWMMNCASTFTKPAIDSSVTKVIYRIKHGLA